MISTLSFGHPPPGAHARLSTSSSPQPSMSSSSDSPVSTPILESGLTPPSEKRSESQEEMRDGLDDIVPKVEERELLLSDVKTEPIAEEPPISPTEPPRVRRGRGRPRLYPPRSPTTSSKQTKARSKTGCTTCRKRKKKCDETRPFCKCASSLTITTQLIWNRSVMSEEQYTL
jgi:hypothetical protein